MHTKNRYWQTTTCLTAVLLVMGAPGVALANPVGGTVSAGGAVISSSGNKTSITQTSDRAVIDWHGFDIGAGETTQFYQPSSSSVTLNRVGGSGPSVIDGQLLANGNIFIINPNGVLFGAHSHVDVNGLVASTADVSNANFMAGKFILDIAGNPNASVINRGTITAKEAGLVGLVAPNVVNSGIITARLGRVHLASGDTATVDLYGDGLLEVAVSDKVKSQLVSNTGIISADGGTIALTAAAGRSVVNSVVTVSGELSAMSVGSKNGRIIIAAEGSNKTNKSGSSSVTVSGTLNASGKGANETGGSISVTGDHLLLQSGALLDASGSLGGGTVLVGGDEHGLGATATSLTTTFEQGATITADALVNGKGGKVILWSDGRTEFSGAISAKGGALGGLGGFTETSGHDQLKVTGTVNLTSADGNAGTWLLDPTDITIYGSAHAAGDGTNTFNTTQLQTMSTSADVVLSATHDITLDLATDTLNITTANRAISLTAGDVITTASAGRITTNNGAISFAGTNGILFNNGFTFNSAGGAINFTGPVTLGAILNANAVGGNVAFSSTIDGGNDLTISNANSLTFGGAIGGTTALGNITLAATNALTLPAITTQAGKTVSVTVNGAGNKLTTSAITTGAGGNITLTADDLDLLGNVSGTGTLTMQQYTNITRGLRINFGADDGSTFYLSTADLSHLSDGWSQINVGNTTQNVIGSIGASSWIDPVTFRSNLGNYQMSGNMTGTDNAAFTFANSYVEIDATTISTQGGAINFLTGSVNGVVSPYAGGAIISNGGNISLGKVTIYHNAGASLAINSGGGNITVNGIVTEDATTTNSRTLSFDSGAGNTSFASTVNTNADVTVNGKTITLGGAWGGTRTMGNVSLTAVNSITLPAIATATGKSITVTTTDAAGDITVAGALSGAALTLTAGHDVIDSTASANLTAATGDILIKAANSILWSGVNSIVGSGGAITFDADSDASTAGAIALVNTTVTGGNGNIILGGGATPATGYAYGTSSNIDGILLNNAALTTTNFGNITVNGHGYNGASSTFGGIHFTGSTTRLTTAGGNITVNGIGGSNASNNFAIGSWILGGSQLSTMSGAIAISGTGGNGSNAWGSVVQSAGTSVSSTYGNISVTGAGGSAAYAGLLIYDTASIYTLGSGNVTLTSTLGRIWDNNTSATLGNAAMLGNITINADSAAIDTTTIRTAGNFTFAPYSQATAIGLNGASGSLTLSNTTLNHITAANTTIGRSDGTGLIRVLGGSLTSLASNLSLISGSGNIEFDGGATALTLAPNKNFTETSTSGQFITAIAAGTIVTTGTGNQVFNNAITLGQNLTLTGGTGITDFASTIDGANTLVVTNGNIVFGGNVGATTALTGLTATGTTYLNGNITTNNGNVVFNSPTWLEKAVTIATGTGTLAFNSTLDSLNFTPATSFQTLVVAGGGGGGGNGGGGGGAGGLIYNAAGSVTANSLQNVVIGAGGIGSNAALATGFDGGNSIFGTITAIGGGGGASRDSVSGLTGGSGGGGGGSGGQYSLLGYLAGSGTAGQGNNGGNGVFNSFNAGGGGGAGGAGAVAVAGASGNGGAGLTYSISGTATAYAGGGGGGNDSGTTSRGLGGLGGGGNGADTGHLNTAGAANTGGGGGGGTNGYGDGAAGGSGVVIVRYTGTANQALVSGGTATTVGSDTVYTYTSGTGSFIALNGCASGCGLTTTTGSTTFNGAVGGNGALGAISITGATNLGGNITTNNANITFNSPLLLTNDDSINSGTGTVTFGSTVDSAAAPTMQVVLVGAGGGSGGRVGTGGGGGAIDAFTVSGFTDSTLYNIVVGAGGLNSFGASGSQYLAASAGSATTAFGATAAGGGAGASSLGTTVVGGTSGGGGTSSLGGNTASSSYIVSGANGTGIYTGNAGGALGFQVAGGGGGAGTASTTANGGNGLQSNISGTSYYYGGGGAGAADAVGGNNAGNGGLGGGGGGQSGTGAPYTPGTGGTGGVNNGQSGGTNNAANSANGGANTGGGGGGTWSNNNLTSGNGGSGVAYIRYTGPSSKASVTGGTVSTVGGDTLVTFTNTGTSSFSFLGNNLTVNAGTITANGAIGNINGLGTVSLTSTNSMTLPSIKAGSISATTTGAAADLTVSGTLAASAAGAAISLAAGHDLLDSTNGANISASNATGNVLLKAGNSIVWTPFTATSITTSGGTITLNSDSDADNAGAISLTNTTLNSTTGDIILGGGLTPLSGYAYGSTYGIYFQGGGISSISGNITLNGNGAIVGNYIYSNALLHTGSGAINMNGIGNDKSGSGIRIDSAAQIYTANGNINLTGTLNNTGTNWANGSAGIQLSRAGTIYSTSGNVALTGTNTGVNVNDFGILLESLGFTQNDPIYSGSGTLTLTGQGSTNSVDIKSGPSGATQTLGNALQSGNIYINANTLDLTTDPTTITTTGNVIIAPRTASSTIGVNGGPGTLQVTNALLNNITAATTTIGRNDGTGLMRVLGGSLTSLVSNLTLLNGSADIQYDGGATALTLGANKNFTETSTSGKFLTATNAGTITTTGTGNIILNNAAVLGTDLALNTGTAGSVLFGSTVDSAAAPTLQVVLVGGGGGSGGRIGGGGGGGAIDAFTVSGFTDGTLYNVVVGAGGLNSYGASGSQYLGASAGSATTAFGATAAGGGAGGAGVGGASGGGGTSSLGGNTASSTYIVSGANGTGLYTGNAAAPYVSSGAAAAGGGAGAAATNQNGGNGLQSNISGISYYYGGGGGGASDNSGGNNAGNGGLGGGGGGQTGSTTPGTGGTGGVNNGQSGGTNNVANVANGGANTGGGGGGTWSNDKLTSGNGGSGVAYLRYTGSSAKAVVTGGATVSTVGGDTLITFTNTGTGSFTFLGQNLTVNAGTITANGAMGNINGLGTVNLTSTNSLTLPSIKASSISATTTGATADITVSNTLAASAAGAAISLASAHDLLNSTNSANISSASATGNVLLSAANSIVWAPSTAASITTQGGTITLDSDSDANTGGAINLSKTTVTSNGGNITMGGGATPATGMAYGTATSPAGITLTNTPINAGAGNILLNGHGQNNGSVDGAMGVTISGAASIIQTTTGSITVNGTGGTTGTGNYAYGTYVSTSGSIVSTSGAITMNGTGGSTSGSHHFGAGFQSSGSVHSTTGNITINGTGGIGGGGSSDNSGILASAGTIYTTGAGNVTLNGVAGTGSSTAYGITDFSVATTLGNAAMTGIYKLVADTALLNSTTLTTATGGSVVIAPYSQNSTIGVAGAPGALQVTSTLLGKISTPNLTIGRIDGTGLMRVNGIDLSARNYNLLLTNGSGNIQYDGGATALTMAANKNFTETTSNSGSFVTATNAGTITTSGTGNITFSGPVLLGANLSLNAGATGTVTFNGTVDSLATLASLQALLVGGGGSGGGLAGGGGGAGGVDAFSRTVAGGDTTSVVIGAGAAACGGGGTSGCSGSSSTAFGAVAAGGGAGGGYYTNQFATGGGSGGGVGGAGGAAGASTGNSLGTGNVASSTYIVSGANGSGIYGTAGSAGGGGGGAGATTSTAAGGAGIQSNITGTSYYYAGGGGASGGVGGLGGGGGGSPGSGSAGNAGGTGGTTDGQTPGVHVNGGAGGANTGSGGGGSAGGATAGGAGGSGVAVIRYTGVQAQTVVTGATTTTVGGDVVLTYPTNGTFTVNSFTPSNLTVNAGTITASGAMGATTALGNVSLTSANTLTLPSIKAATIAATTTGSTADINVAGSLAASATGAAIALTSGRDLLDSTNGANIAASNANGNVLLKAANSILWSGGPGISTQGGSITFNSDNDGSSAGAISIGSGTMVASNGGNIALGGGTAGTGAGMAYGTSATPQGIYLAGTLNAKGTAASGNIALNGTGWAASVAASPVISTAYGVVLDGGTIQTNFAGTVTGTGVAGGASGAATNGIHLVNSGQISTVDGAVNLTGTGSTTATTSGGIVFSATGTNKITSTGAGTITLNATGGGTTTADINAGIVMHSGTGGVFSGSGAVSITATNGTGAMDIFTNGGQNAGTIGGASASGDITINTNTFNFTGTDPVVQTTGDVYLKNRTTTAGRTVGGTAGGGTINTSFLNKVSAANLIIGRSDGGNTLIVNGVDLSSRNYNLKLLSGSANIQFNGGTLTLGANKNFTETAATGKFVTATAAGGITTSGTGTQTYSNALSLGQNFTSTTGSSGTSTFASTIDGANNFTVNAGTITLGGALGSTTALGNVTLTAVNSLTLPAITTVAGKTVNATVTGANNNITVSGAIATGAAGNISFMSDDVAINAALSGTGTLTLQQNAIARGMRVNSGTDNGANYYLDLTELAQFTDGWSQINLGRSDGTAGFNIGSGTFTDPVAFRNAFALGAFGLLTGTGNASFTFTTAGDISLLAGATTASGAVAYNAANILLSNSTTKTITTNGGNITFNGKISNSQSIAGNGLTANAGTGLVAFGDTVATAAGMIPINVSATGTGISFNGDWGTSSLGVGTVNLTSVNSMTLPTIYASTVNATVTGAGNKLTANAINVGAGGNITLTADDMDLLGNLSGTGALILQNSAANRNISLATGPDDGSTLYLSTSDLSRLVDGWSGITIGNALANGLSGFSTTLSFSDPVTFVSHSNNMGTVIGTDNASLTFTSLGNNFYDITTAGGAVTFNGNITYTNSAAHNITTNSGSILVTGRIYATQVQPYSLTLNAGSGNVTVNGTVDNYASNTNGFDVTVTGATLALGSAWGGITALGNVTLTALNALTLPSITAANIFAQTTGATSDLTIPVGKIVKASGSGNALTLAAGRNFINNAGASALSLTGGGRWLVYTSNPTDTVGEESLSQSFNRYSCAFSSVGTCAASATLGTTVAIPTSGNGLIYSYTPVITATPTTQANITYGDAANLIGYGYALSGYRVGEGTDTITGSLTGSSTYAQGSDVGVYNVNYASGSLASALGYQITYANNASALNVIKRVLTTTLTGTVSKTYDGTTAATLAANNYNISNIYNGDDVGITNTAGLYNNKNAATGKNVTVSGLLLGGTKSGNYSLGALTVSGNVGTITQKALTITATGVDKVYNGDAIGSVTLSDDRIAGDNFTEGYGSATYLDKNAGTNKLLNVTGIAISGGDAANYTFNTTATTTATIAQKTLDVTIANQGVTYGTAAPSTSTYTYNGFAGTDSVTDITTAPVVASAHSGILDAGTYTANYTGSGGVATNYAFNYIPGNLVVTPKPLNVTADNKTINYGDLVPATTFTYSGFISGQDASFLDTAPTGHSTITPGTVLNAGSYAGNYTVSGGVDTNYSFNYIAGNLGVNTVGINVTVASKTVTYGTSVPTTSYVYTGFVNGDTASNAIVSNPTIASGQSGIVNAGTYTNNYTVSGGATNSNYFFNYIPADLTVTKASLNVVADNQTITYGVNVPSGTFHYSGFVNGDTASMIDVSPLVSSGLSGKVNVGTYNNNYTASGGSDNNYAFSYISGNLNISPKPVTITANNQVLNYGAGNTLNGYTSTALAPGETLDSVTLATDAQSSSSGNWAYRATPWTITASNATGSGGFLASNYSISYASGTLTIIPKALTISATSAGKVYDGTTGALVTLSDDRIGGDAFTTENYSSAVYLDKNAATGKTINVGGISIAGVDAANYTFNTAATTTSTITPRSLTVTAGAGQSKIYGDADAINYTYGALQTGDTASIISGALSRATPTVQDVGTYLVNLGTLAAGGNYTLSLNATPATYSITPRSLTVAAVAQNKIYGNTDAALTYTYGTLYNGDTASVFSGALARDAGESVGSYVIRQSTLSAGGNYAITYTPANLTINAAALNLTISANPGSKYAGEVDPALTFTHSALLNGDTDTIFTGALARDAGESVGQYLIRIGTLSAGQNYVVTFNGNDFTILARPIPPVPPINGGTTIPDSVMRSAQTSAANLEDWEARYIQNQLNGAFYDEALVRMTSKSSSSVPAYIPTLDHETDWHVVPRVSASPELLRRLGLQSISL